jgi:hypothetical protein
MKEKSAVFFADATQGNEILLANNFENFRSEWVVLLTKLNERVLTPLWSVRKSQLKLPHRRHGFLSKLFKRMLSNSLELKPGGDLEDTYALL